MTTVYAILTRTLRIFPSDVQGGAAVHAALLFSVVGMALALLATPHLNRAAQLHAANQSLGIDRVVTGSIGKPKRYTIRRSVLDIPSSRQF